jgi:hypothetical protein
MNLQPSQSKVLLKNRKNKAHRNSGTCSKQTVYKISMCNNKRGMSTISNDWTYKTVSQAMAYKC